MSNKSLDTLVEDIYGILDPEVDHIADEDRLAELGKTIAYVIADHLRARDPKRGPLRFSAIGKQPRQLWYDANGDQAEAEKMDGQTMLKFLYGHMIEAALLFLAKEAGHDVSCEQEEVNVDGVKGHLDAVIDGVVVDVKSASPFGYVKFAKGELDPRDDSFGYIRQLSGYANVKQMPAAFWAAQKVDGSMCISPLSGYAIEGHPPKPRIKLLKEVIANPKPPPRCFKPKPEGKSGNMILPTGCSYCKWKWPCWADANGGIGLRLFFYSNGPKWFTEVKKEPKVPEKGKEHNN